MYEIKLIGATGDYPIPKPWIFKPIKRLKIKFIIYYLIIQIGLFLGLALGFYIEYLLGEDNDDLIPFVFFLYVIGFIFIGLIIMFLIYKYVNSFEFQVHGTEIVIKKGLFNITENHVPFTNVTNIYIRKGIFDRLLSIGSIIIHTAGKNETPFSSIKIEGIFMYNEVGHYIVKEIKNFESYLNILALDYKNYNQDEDQEFWIQFNNQIIDIKRLFNERFT